MVVNVILFGVMTPIGGSSPLLLEIKLFPDILFSLLLIHWVIYVHIRETTNNTIVSLTTGLTSCFFLFLKDLFEPAIHNLSTKTKPVNNLFDFLH